MILQINRFKFSNNHNHHHKRHLRNMSEADLASLQAFRSQVSEKLNRVLESLKLRSEFVSLTWIHECFHMLPMINNDFAKLMVEIDYAMSTWESSSIDEYLDYTMNLLELLNSISSSISHVNHARVLLMHALSLMESSPIMAIERMKEIKKHDCVKELKVRNLDPIKRNGNGNEKDWIFHEAIMVLKSIGLWVCGVVLLALKNDDKPIMEMMKHGVFVDSTLMVLDNIFRKKFMDEGGFVKEVDSVNESVHLVVSSGISDCKNGMELKRRLEVFGNGLKCLKEEEEGLFGSVLAARNEVLEALRNNDSH
ncbi:protein BPS1, chloroplastic-like [Rutidosis leptorrhynchoides]|uniref:protein BPS1, chloroplastic-like n=1 Tax=Rutidosis leptorrhynchoides TaxID=125765 RepID=UPI003A9A0969